MKPDTVEMIMKHQILTRATGMPASAAARILPPVAVVCTPKRVCFRRNQISATTSMAHRMVAQLPMPRILL